MQEWFDGRAADGFNVVPSVFPEGLEDFTQLVVPIFQERGLFRTEYESQRCAIMSVCAPAAVTTASAANSVDTVALHVEDMQFLRRKADRD